MGKSICVFCGAKDGMSEAIKLAAHELGVWIANQGHQMVYGGGRVGLMGVVADAALTHGAHIVGVIPKDLMDKELAHQGIQELIVTDSMHHRKEVMASRSDIFIALPGGFGTMDELCEIITWAQLGFHRKPIYLLNIESYYDYFISFYRQAIKMGFIEEQDEELIKIAESVNKLILPQSN